MPLHIVQRGDQHCLADDDDNVEYCHDTHQEAVEQLRAINANKSDIGATNMADKDAETKEENLAEGGTKIIHPKSIDEKSKKADKSGWYFATSFEELDEARMAEEKRQETVTIISDFMTLSANAMEWEEDPVKAIESLASEMVVRLKNGAGRTEEAAGDASKQAGEQAFDINDHRIDRTDFMVWKQEDGTYRWLGVYSNKFRDDDKPVAEIISEKAHQEFIGRVNSGEIENPDLYVWHIPVSVGKSDLLAYDDSGFSVVSGTFTNKSVAEALLVTSEDLAMSHGMPAEFIERDSNDKSIITRYVSTEVSVLPREAAANKRTAFGVVREAKEDTMAINSELRGKVVGMIGEEATATLEEGLEKVAAKAVEDNIDYKEQGEGEAQADTAVASEEPGTEEAGVGASAEETSSEESATQGEEGASEKGTDGDAGEEAGGEEGVDPMLALKQEIAELVFQVVKTVETSNEAIVSRLEALEQKASTQEEEKEKKEADRAAESTPASIASLLASQLSGSRASSVIGKSATQVHGNSALAKDAPEENEGNEEKAQGPLFFQQWTN